MTFEQIKKNYDRGLWNKLQVQVCLTKGLITQEQYNEITNEH